jgi:hypothetical protein
MPVGGGSLRHGFATCICVTFLLLVGAASSVCASTYAGDDGLAEWTVMMYVAGDNDLEGMAPVNLDEIEGVCPSDDVKVIMLVDTMTLFEGTHWYFVNDGDDHMDLQGGVHRCDCDKVVGGCPGELNMGEGATLGYFVAESADYAPAENYMLVLWDHGASWYGICWDEGALLADGEADCLQMHEIAEALASSSEHLPDGRLQILGFDACLMAGIEVAYELRTHAEYMVAAVTTIPREGWAYDEVIDRMDLKEEPSPFEVGTVIVDTYIDKFSPCAGSGIGGYPYASLSLIDLSIMDALVKEGVKPFSSALLGHVTDDARKGYVQSAEARTPQLQYLGELDPFVDLGLFAEAIAVRYPDMQKTCESVVELVGAAVVYFDYVTSDLGGSMTTTGMSIWYTCSWNHLHDYGGLEYYATMDFGMDTDWDEFLTALSEQPLH